jgi:hypothetical protein
MIPLTPNLPASGVSKRYFMTSGFSNVLYNSLSSNVFLLLAEFNSRIRGDLCTWCKPFHFTRIPPSARSRGHPLRLRPVRPAPSARDDNPAKPARAPHARSASQPHPLRLRPVRPAPPARGDNPGKPATYPFRPVRPALSLTPATVPVGARAAGVKAALAEYQ